MYTCSTACKVAAKFVAAESTVQAAHALVDSAEARDTNPSTTPLYHVSGDLLNLLSGADFVHDVTEAGGGQ